MSCFIMNPLNILNISYTLADILNASYFGNACTLDTYAAVTADLHKAFQRYFSRSRGYNARGIAEDLYALNCKAYNSRYRTNDSTAFPLPVTRDTYSLRTLPEYVRTDSGMYETVRPWHYHIIKLIDCFLYQTDEDATSADPLRAALRAFNNAIMAGIVRRSTDYINAKWD